MWPEDTLLPAGFSGLDKEVAQETPCQGMDKEGWHLQKLLGIHDSPLLCISPLCFYCSSEAVRGNFRLGCRWRAMQGV